MDLKKMIRNVPDFPKKGIVFRDITTLLKDPGGLRAVLDGMESFFRGLEIHKVVGIESRGFILGTALADRLGAGFVPVRKPGKLPAETVRVSYELEYGNDYLELHTDAVEAGEKVIIVDDLLATGGTAAATVKLLHLAKADIVGLAVMVELDFLKGRERLPGIQVWGLVHYDSE
ncbi:MAG: adenine phosphoribosyltransferase [Acidobacteria bacterium]|nr:adenine phosphoribosyltransferase [Acidobacteriota bacterium]